MPNITPLDPKRPRKLGETIWTDRGLSLPLIGRVREARWPWIVLILSPIAGVLVAILWQLL